jgi:hypothetical protein
MPSVTYDDRSFMIDGQRVWLASGAIHYFRVPAALWKDRLLKAKRAGLNCIETYLAWNFHEPLEGKWDFTGDRNVVEFVKLCRELGLYVILRPGPYICAEWDFGGFPGWLTTKTGIAYRTNNAIYTHYYDKYFRQVLPRLAEHQVTRGGNIILVQNENEYQITTMPDRLAYLEFINQLLRRGGFDIPIVNCNYCTDPPVPDNIECVNGSGNLVQWLKKQRRRQPNAPLVVTEFWCGWYDNWGDKHHAQPPETSARIAMEVLGCGGQYNYYMWHGGTNFAFWGSRWPGRDYTFQSTSYDYSAPLAEGGGLNRKYYLTKLVNMLSTHMGRFWATMTMDGPGVTVHNGTQTLNVGGPLGRFAVVTNCGKSEITTARVSMPDGRELDVNLAPFGACALPFDLKLSADVRLDYANVTPLGFFGPRDAEKVLAFYGPPEWQAVISVNGKEIRQPMPRNDEPKVIEHQGLTIVLLSIEAAMRTWVTDEALIVGPTFIGETPDAVELPREAKQYALISYEGQLSHKKAKHQAATKAADPRLSPWRRTAVAAEPLDADLPWQAMGRPRDVDQLGVPYGYVWYRATIRADKPKAHNLYFTELYDRGTVFLNGALLGTWGRGEGASREPLEARLKAGANALTVMVDNLGRANVSERLGERKGFWGSVYDAKPLRLRNWKLARQETYQHRVLPRNMMHLAAGMDRAPVWLAQTTLSLPKQAAVQLSFKDFPHTMAVFCNGRQVEFLPFWNSNYGEITLDSELRSGNNKLELLLWGDVQPKVLEQLRFWLLTADLGAQAQWSWRQWSLPVAAKRPPAMERKHLPVWHEATFALDVAGAKPLFLQLAGAVKGQIFVNGHNVGRHWNIGPQTLYYLPECWLAPQNTLAVFDETGAAPVGSRLVFCPSGPFPETPAK